MGRILTPGSGQGSFLGFKNEAAWGPERNRRGRGGAVRDPFYSDVGFLLSMDGTEGQTTFEDSGPSERTVGDSGVASVTKLITDPYGRTDLGIANFPGGVSQGLTIADAAELEPGNRDWTAEGWAYIDSSNPATVILFGKRANNATAEGLYIAVISRQLVFTADGTSAPGTYGVALNVPFSGVLPFDTPVHWALVHKFSLTSARYRGFAGGIGTVVSQSPDGIPDTTAPFRIGEDSNGFRLVGEMDDVRYTLDVARYTEDFEPPTAPLPKA